MALAAAVRIAQEVASETGLAPARVDGLLALKGVIVQDEVLPLEPRARADRDAAILESLASAFDSLIRARANEGGKLSIVMNGLVDEIDRLTREAASLLRHSRRNCATSSRRSWRNSSPAPRYRKTVSHRKSRCWP